MFFPWLKEEAEASFNSWERGRLCLSYFLFGIWGFNHNPFPSSKTWWPRNNLHAHKFVTHLCKSPRTFHREWQRFSVLTWSVMSLFSSLPLSLASKPCDRTFKNEGRELEGMKKGRGDGWENICGIYHNLGKNRKIKKGWNWPKMGKNTLRREKPNF